jgi:hypothetical protein
MQLSPIERKAMEEFLDLRIGLDRLRKELAGRIQFEFEPTAGVRRSLDKNSAPAEPGVIVTVEALRRAQDALVQGKISMAELTDWAAMLLMNDDFDWPEEPSDEIANWLNDVAMGEMPKEFH